MEEVDPCTEAIILFLRISKDSEINKFYLDWKF